MSGEETAPAEPWRRPVAGGVGAAAAYALAMLGYTALPGTDVSTAAPVVVAAPVLVAYACATVGVPVVLWLRAGLRGPLALLALVLAFWHVVVPLRLFGAGGGDAPGFLFVFVGAPLYLAAYAVVGGAEWAVRRRG